MNDANKTVLRSSFVPKAFIWKETLQKSRLLWVSWSSCRWWVGWPAGWTDCRSPATHKQTRVWALEGSRTEECVRAPEKHKLLQTWEAALPVPSSTDIFYINLRQNRALKNCSCRNLASYMLMVPLLTPTTVVMSLGKYTSSITEWIRFWSNVYIRNDSELQNQT